MLKITCFILERLQSTHLNSPTGLTVLERRQWGWKPTRDSFICGFRDCLEPHLTVPFPANDTYFILNVYISCQRNFSNQQKKTTDPKSDRSVRRRSVRWNEARWKLWPTPSEPQTTYNLPLCWNYLRRSASEKCCCLFRDRWEIISYLKLAAEWARKWKNEISNGVVVTTRAGW